MVWIPVENLEIPDNSIEEVKLKVTNEPVQGDILTAGPDNNFTWSTKTSSDFVLGPNPIFELTPRKTPGTEHLCTPFGPGPQNIFYEGRFVGANRNGVLINTPDARTTCLLYTSPSPRDRQKSRMPSSA